MKVRIQSFTPNTAHFMDAIHIYRQSTGAAEADAIDFFTEYARTKPGYIGLVALNEAQTVTGMVFGTRSLPGDWWHDHIAEAVGAAHPALQNAWVLIELHVAAAYRNLGIGTRLHNAVLARQPCQKLLLSTGKYNTGAKRLYERLGWQYLHLGLALRPGSSPSVIMHYNLEAP